MHMFSGPVYPVLLAGGSGTRLWPVSRELYPKQLAKLIGTESLIQSTIRRLTPPFAEERLRIVCGGQHGHEVARHMEEIGVAAAGKIISEPSGRNTAPAILLAALHIAAVEPEAVLGVFPADHMIGDVPGFHKRLASAVRLARQGHIVTFGIQPHYPETGYGYVEGGGPVAEGALTIRRFVEKPDLKTAQDYLAAGNFFWNSGMFAFQAAVILAEFRLLQPRMLDALQGFVASGLPISRADYDRLPDLSIDYAVMEQTKKGVVLPSDFGWSDVGSWKSLYDVLPKDENGNVIDGDVIAQETRNCFVLGYERLIATSHLENTVVVETPDSVFVSPIEQSREVKTIVAELKKRGRAETHQHLTAYFPWGTRALLERAEGFEVMRLRIYPRATAALPATRGADRHVVVVEGGGELSAGGQTQPLERGKSLTLAPGAESRIANTGPYPLQVVEVVFGVVNDTEKGALQRDDR
jgi:mannose-1-phosphate guanylyltransferase/mannose-6-phosphate isomerase